jgi:hypothetical protein
MSSDAHDFNNIETRAVINFIFPARQGAEGNSCHSDRNITGKCATVKNWVAQFNLLIFTSMMRLVLDDPKQ